jgi:A/G-specific adenine glycosylase
LSEVIDFSTTLLQWYKLHGRTGLPWQNQKDPYKVWLSEIMLQQTQVATVKERYLEFINIFPTVHDLAGASQDQVMALWAGLGYYTRARNLHACAKVIEEKFAGQFPASSDILVTLPGIGMSTAAAIASFCFGERTSILDANVKRLLARFLGIEEDVKKASAHQDLWNKAQTFVPQNSEDMPAYTQALMDFGATVCTPKKPQCSNCVFQSSCEAFAQSKVSTIPLQVKKAKNKIVQSEMLFILANHQALFELRPEKGIWGGLWSLPESNWAETIQAPSEPLQLSIGDFRGLPSDVLELPYKAAKLLAPRKHVFTHRTLYFQIRIIQLTEKIDVNTNQYQWVNLSDCEHLGLPTPIRQWVNDYLCS